MYEVTENFLATMALEPCPKKNAFGTRVFFPENLLATMALEPYPKKMRSEQEYYFQENFLNSFWSLGHDDSRGRRIDVFPNSF